MIRRILPIALLVAALAGPAAAQNAPPWDPTLDNQTTQIWETLGTPPANGQDVEPTTYLNEFGTPLLTLEGSWNSTEVAGPFGTPVTTWHAGPGGGTMVLTIPNFPEPNLIKRIFWQITADQPFDNPTTNPEGVSQAPPYTPIGFEGDWFLYNGLNEIPGNPPSEELIFVFPESTNITEVSVDTICIPEPASLGVLGVAGLALLRRRR